MYSTDEPTPSAYRCSCGGKVVRKEIDSDDPKERQLRWYCEKCEKYFGFPWYAWQWEGPESGTVLVGFEVWKDEIIFATGAAMPLAGTVALLQPRPRGNVAEALQRGIAAVVISAVSIFLLLSALIEHASQLAQRFVI